MSELYTIDQVSHHNTENDCWMVINNKVLDVTKFLSEHPGGAEVLMDVAGKECTQEFNDVGHSADAIQMLDDYIIGRLDAPAPVATPQRNDTLSSSWLASNFDLVISFGVLIAG